MYFPYLRGRQFEVIAIRELLEKGLISHSIVPIIEPVKLSTTLFKTLKLYHEQDREIILIHNPKEGDYKKSIENITEILESKLDSNDNITLAHIMNENSQAEIDSLSSLKNITENIMTIVLKNDYISEYPNFKSKLGELTLKYNLIPDQRSFRREIEGANIVIEDKFFKRQRNSDYPNDTEFFSEEHLYYQDEGYVGYSDYSIVGSGYSESGFAPYAVAIHITYFDENMCLRIAHFVSDSNFDIKDPGNKFLEALEKLYEWSKNQNINTYGLDELIKHYHAKTYPGL